MSVVRVPKAMILSSLIKEHWTADTKEELMQTFESEERAYPTQGYGTMVSNVHQDPTGLLWHAEFMRYTSCD